MFCRLSFFLAFTSLAWSAPHFEYRAIGVRAENNDTTSKPSLTGTGTMPMVTDTNVFNLSSYCKAQSKHFTANYNPTGKLTTTTVTNYQGFDDTGEQTGSIVSQTYSTTTVTYTEEAYAAYENGGAKPPCCSTCQMSAGTIQFYWWPDLAKSTATASPSITSDASGPPVTAIAPNGFTFTSPSVYMAFSSLFAQNYCGTVGNVWYNTTIGFHPTEMTTLNAYTTTFTSWSMSTEDGEVESVFVTAKGYQPPPSRLKYKDLAQNCSSIAGYVYFPDDPQNDLVGTSEQDPCHPILQLPDSLIDMQPAWADNHCKAYQGTGAYDPPQALTAAQNEAMPTLSSPASPGSTGSSNSAPATSTYAVQTETKLTSSADPSTSSQASETTLIIGGGSTSMTYTPVPSPIVESSATGLDSATNSDGPTFLSPDTQHTASELDTPSRSSSAVTVTSEGEEGPAGTTRLYKPEIESSQTSLIVPGGNGGATYTVDQPSHMATWTVIQETTLENGQTSVATFTTGVPPPAMQTSAGPVRGSAVPYTIIQETTMANGEATVVTSTAYLHTGDALHPAATPAPVITVGGQTYTVDASSNFIIGGQTIVPNGAMYNIDNTPIAILPGGSSAIIGGSTVSLAMGTPTPPSITMGNDVLTANSAGAYVVSPETTLSVGGSSVTVDNTAYALTTNTAGETVLVAGAVTTSTSSVNVGNYIMSALGQNDTRSSTEHSTTSTTAKPSNGGHAGNVATTSIATGDAASVSRRSALALCFLMLLVVTL